MPAGAGGADGGPARVCGYSRTSWRRRLPDDEEQLVGVLTARGTPRAVAAPVRCLCCDLEHGAGPCLRAVAGLVRLLLWEIRELRVAVEQLREERRREAALRTKVRG